MSAGAAAEDRGLGRVIALEEHMLPADLTAAAGIDPRVLLGEGGALDDVGEGRLATLDRAGIDVQVLSTVGQWAQDLEPAAAVAACRDLNDRLAAAVAAHPERFRGFAALPMSDPERAAEELARAVEELGFVGALINGLCGGAFLDEPRFRPVLAAAERLGRPLYLHPGPPPATVRDAYFGGLPDGVGPLLATAGWGWHAECGLHVLRLAVSGTLDRFPDLQLIVGHMGENLPFSLARADERLTPVATGLAETVADTVRRHVHITTCGYTTEAPLRCAVEVFGVERMMFSVDYPFSDCAEATAFLRAAPLGEDDKRRIAHLNAERLLKI